MEGTTLEAAGSTNGFCVASDANHDLARLFELRTNPPAGHPAAAQLAPRPAAPRSNTVTAQPEAARRQPMLRPMTPPPMMATEDGERRDGTERLEMAGSLRWHDPDWFVGYAAL